MVILLIESIVKDFVKRLRTLLILRLLFSGTKRYITDA